jgi:hypothetical protein
MMNHFSNKVSDLLLAPAYHSEQYIEQYLKPYMRRFQVMVALLNQISAPAMRVVDIGSHGSLVPGLIELLRVQDTTITRPRQENRPSSEETGLTEARYDDKYRFRVDRITQPGDWLLLSKPNCASSKSVLKILRGGNPYLYPVYTKQRSRDRHNREYTPGEVRQLLVACGYELAKFETVDVCADKATLPLRLVHGALRIGRYVSLALIEFHERMTQFSLLARKSQRCGEWYPAFL